MAEERLTELQRAAAERVYTRARNAFLAYALTSLVLLPAALLTMLWAIGSLDHRHWFGLAAAFTALAIALPISLAKGLERGRAALPLRRDLEDGFSWVFEGRIAQARYEEEDAELSALLEADLLRRDDCEQRICVLPRSGRLIQANGRNLPPERRLHVATTAAWPEHLFRYSLPPEVKEVFGPSARNLKRRRLAVPERNELSRHIARLTGIPWLLIGLTAVASTVISLWLTRDRRLIHDLFALCWVAVWIASALRHIRGYALARRLEADLEVGWLLSWEAAESVRPKGDSGTLGEPPFRRAEVLPVSQRDWMIDGKPAAWRRALSRPR